jgi:hypothetical protein
VLWPGVVPEGDERSAPRELISYLLWRATLNSMLLEEVPEVIRAAFFGHDTAVNLASYTDLTDTSSMLAAARRLRAVWRAELRSSPDKAWPDWVLRRPPSNTRRRSASPTGCCGQLDLPRLVTRLIATATTKVPKK